MRSQILGWLGDSFWQLLWWWCECCYRGPTHKSQIWGWLSVAFWRWIPFSMKLNDEPWWKFSYQSSWDVWLVSLIPCFGGLCEERLPCFDCIPNQTGQGSKAEQNLSNNGMNPMSDYCIFTEVSKFSFYSTDVQIHGGNRHPPAHSLQRVPSSGKFFSFHDRWYLFNALAQALESGPPEEQKHVRLPVA